MKLALDSGHRRRQQRAAQDARAAEYTRPRKADLRAMLAEAVKNTAALQIDFEDMEVVYQDDEQREDNDSDFDHPNCGQTQDGFCILEYDWCLRNCPKGNAGGPG